MTDYQILLINNGLLISPFMTPKQAQKYIAAHPNFEFKAAAL